VTTTDPAERLLLDWQQEIRISNRDKKLMLDAALAAAYQRGQTDERERQIAVRKDWGTLPHGEFHQKYGTLARDLHLLPSNCSCRECQMWAT